MTRRHTAALIIMVFAMASAVAGNHLLKADGSTDTYKLISDAGYFTESSASATPDGFMGHGSYRHISQVYDDAYGGHVFAFDIHIDYAEGGKTITDGNKGELVDRQRNEIKCMPKVPDMVASDGERLTYRWKFRLPEGMLTTSEFCHIHQIKGVGSSEAVAHPVITFTCRTTSGRQVLQIINVPYEGARNVNLAQIDLSALTGRWVEAEETFTVGHHGDYRLVLKDVATGRGLLSVDKKDIEVWRDTDDASTMRGKWGIYRSLGEGLSLKKQLRSERVLFADFEAIKGDLPSALQDVTVDPDSDDQPVFDLLGRPADENSKGFLVKNKKLIFKK